MILISHRGNIEGPNTKKENDPRYIDIAISEGYDVEIDLRACYDKCYLGHDSGQYEVSKYWLLERSNRLWIHCKNSDALGFCSSNPSLNYFWHETDKYTITSKGFIWAYPGVMPVGNNTIMVLPEVFWGHESSLSIVSPLFPLGICSDYIGKYVR